MPTRLSMTICVGCAVPPVVIIALLYAPALTGSFSARPLPNCTSEVGMPVDQYPMRSPQDVQSVIAAIVRGHSVVEIGTRNGDGMECFARFASAAVAIEFNEKYCELLRKRSLSSRSAGGGRGFDVRCGRYQDVVVDGDYYTWWSERPHLQNVPALVHLRRAQLARKIRSSAKALVLLSDGELERYRRSAVVQLATSIRAAPFQEVAHQHAKVHGREAFPDAGVWHVLIIPLSAVHADRASEWKDDMQFGPITPSHRS